MLNADVVLGFGSRLMHQYEGVGFPLKLAETAKSSVDCYLGLSKVAF